MKSKFLFILCLFVTSHSFSQNGDKKSVLFLLPFHLDKMNEINLDAIEDNAHIYATKSFETVDFWEGAKMAIREFQDRNVEIDIIVRDISSGEDTAKLRKVLQDPKIKDVDLIIGPFYSKVFFLAAQFAKENKIPIVTPFSSRRDLVDSNAMVYKLLPPPESIPQKLDKSLLREYPNHNIILWVDGKQPLKEEEVYENYFKQNQIQYHKVRFSEGVKTLINKLSSKKNNIVIAIDDDHFEIAKTVDDIRQLVVSVNHPLILVAPQSWISSNNIEVDYLNQLNTYYFDRYFVDYSREDVQYFVNDYIYNYQAPPEVSYAFQGYDIAKYFIELMLQNFDLSKVKVETLAIPFLFEKVEGGGYENQKIKLISIQNSILKEVE